MDTNKKLLIGGILIAGAGAAYYFLYYKKKKSTSGTDNKTTAAETDTKSPIKAIEDFFSNTKTPDSSSTLPTSTVNVPVSTANDVALTKYEKIVQDQPAGIDKTGRNDWTPYVTNFTKGDIPSYKSPNGKQIQFVIVNTWYPSIASKKTVYDYLETSDGIDNTYNYIGANIVGDKTLYPMNFKTAKANGFVGDIEDIVIAGQNYVSQFNKYSGTGEDYGLLKNGQLI